MKTRLIHEIGTRGSLRVYWNREEVTSSDLPLRMPLNECPNSMGYGNPGYHNAEIVIGQIPDRRASGKSFGLVADFADDQWPTQCDYCAAPIPVGGPYAGQLRQDGYSVTRQIFCRTVFNTVSGYPEPGDLYWADWYHHSDENCFFFDNCNGEHLIAVLPSGEEWSIDSQAYNCTLPEDRVHRCWIRHGKPEDGTIHVDKNGITCQAGAGSIQTKKYHGFLHNGNFTP